ncbi:tRNA 2-thiouridine(34) synthase MnmA [Desulfoplanes sp.]
MTIALALSGGADSLLSLALLKEQGWDVVGFHGLFLPPSPGDNERTEEMEKLCRGLGVPLETVDLSGPFFQQIIQPFIDGYIQARTPNPCAWCNREIKFGLLRERIRRHGPTKLATGHYARTLPTPQGTGLFRALDPGKDQSYFLSLVPGHIWEGVILPLGGWHKSEVPKALEQRSLEPPVTKESQEICFIPDDYRAFLARQGIALPGPGPVTTRSGKRIGTHQGLWRYTQGQRRGLKIAYAHPLYVIDKEPATNTLIVGPQKELWATSCTAVQANLLVPAVHWPEEVLVQTRYRQQAGPARVTVEGQRLLARFILPQEVPTPGQVLTVYAPSGQVLAGGIISHGG